ncbi:hypothetical protein TEA_018484 [Camellia sinensis var. sinensis]|uniref:TELO2 ARM repeat domain-containing protein n=1 Tax=Camellia sinensis var. sinensis TaxID=542762 RepID=A0A4S4F1J2_CAMSN|nr:hypothetical protein TEA_018484 [Camellia sinensis var. sinensis]
MVGGCIRGGAMEVESKEKEEEEEEKKSSRELEATILEKVGNVTAFIKEAKHVDEVICALHSLVILLFPPLDSQHDLPGSIDQQYRDQVLSAKVPSELERTDCWRVFYQGAAFPTLARALLYDVASNWLAFFPISARKHVYDVFFVNGHTMEVFHTVVPSLLQNGSGSFDIKAVCSNAERLLALCLLENDGVLQMAQAFGVSCQSEDNSTEELYSKISRVAQLITSIPDKAQLTTSSSLSSQKEFTWMFSLGDRGFHGPRFPTSIALLKGLTLDPKSFFFKQITIQLIAGAEEWDVNLCSKDVIFNKMGLDGTILFVGESFARICRRGSADVLLSQVIPHILRHVHSILLSNADVVVRKVFETNPGSQIWLKLVEAIKDPYAVERLSEQLLHQLAAERVTDVEAYWILWILFHQIFEHQTPFRSMFVEKFLLWKVFPVCCLRWILQFAVLELPPDAALPTKAHNAHHLLDTTQHLAGVWSKREFVQSAPVEQQACILKSCRLENPAHLVRRMASRIALVFSKIIDPKNPLYLDDSCSGEIIDWEFGLATPAKGMLTTSQCIDKDINKVKPCSALLSKKEFNNTANSRVRNNDKAGKSKLSEFKLVDPDEIIDPATLNKELVSGEEEEEEDDDDASENSDTSSDSSLQPYDLSDDDTDLKRKLSHLVDVVGALRKSDDADGKESVKWKVPLPIVGLAAKFTNIKVLLLFSLPVISKLSSNLLDEFNAALELADTKIMKPKHQPRNLISTISETQPWFMPSSIGPPGAGPWKEISGTEAPWNWSYSYEREVPPRPGQIKRGKTRRWSFQSANIQGHQMEWSQNKFPQYAAAFMLPAIQGFDKKRHGIDLLGRDFIVLGKLIYMLGVCMKCTAIHPEASAIAPALIDMSSSREICHHAEAYVRRSVLFAASCILVALHPSYVASSLIEGSPEISKGLEWVRTWALCVAESDTDRECYTLAVTCLQLHAEMALQASRAIESVESTSKAKSIDMPSNLLKGIIKIPHSNVEY